MEFLHVFGKERFRRELSPRFAHLSAITGWNDATIRRAYYEFVITALTDLLSPFRWEEIPLTSDIQGQSIVFMGEYNLDSQDAAHLACARSIGIRDLASFDRHFRRVDRLNLWND